MKRWKFTLATSDRRLEIDYTVESADDVDMMEMLRRVNLDRNDPTSRVVMIREMKR